MGVIASFIAGFLFFWFLSSQKPDIVISQSIAKTTTEGGKYNYVIKIINKTDRVNIDVKTELHLVRPRVVPGGVIESRTRQIEIKNSPLIALTTAFRFQIEENLEEIWTDDDIEFLKFTLITRDSFSSVSRVFVQSFHSKANQIKRGEFEAGESLEIK